MKTVIYKIEKPFHTSADFRDAERLAAIPDDSIDYSDAPPLTVDDLKRAVPNPYINKRRSRVTVSLDPEVLAWLKAREGRAYQARLNAILKRAMLEDLKSPA